MDSPVDRQLHSKVLEVLRNRKPLWALDIGGGEQINMKKAGIWV
jgi:hypothetical protein